MPFGETYVVDARRRFVIEVQRSVKSFSAICQRYGISRLTGYKWLKRWEHEGFFERKRLILDSPDPRRKSRGRSGGTYNGRRTVKKVLYRSMPLAQ